MRLIDADKLYDEIAQYRDDGMFGGGTLLVDDILEDINLSPTVDAEPVRHGKWIEWNGMDIPENHGRHKCSICGEFAIKPKYGEEILTKRCNNCGAKMDGD